MASGLSPEEQLFKIIQQQKESPSSASLPDAGPLPEDSGVPQKKGIAGFDGIRSFFTDLRLGRWAALRPKFEELNIELANRALLVVLFLLLAALVYGAVAHRPSLAKIVQSTANTQNPEAVNLVKAGDLMPLSFYVDQSRSRNMFLPAPLNSAEAPAPLKMAVDTGKLKELKGDLKLMGIAWGKYPKVVIKNEKENKIYFLEEHQQVGSTGIEVKSILEHKVIVKIGDENEELV
jgi:hypothetical protein